MPFHGTLRFYYTLRWIALQETVKGKKYCSEQCIEYATICIQIKYTHIILIFSSVQFNRSVVSDSLRPHGLQHARPPCISPIPRVHPNPCPSSQWSSQWCHPTISSSVIPFSSCLQSFPASGSFQMSQFFTSSGQSIGVSASPLITWLIMHWSHGYHALITWLIRHCSRVWPCTDHVADHTLLT